MALDGTLVGKASGKGAAGTLSVTLGGDQATGDESPNTNNQLYYPNGQRVLTVTQDKVLLATDNTAGGNVGNLIDTSSADMPLTNAVGIGQISQAQISEGGFDNVSLRVQNVETSLKTNQIEFADGVTLAAPSTVTLDATALSGAANIQASQVILKNSNGTVLAAQDVMTGSGALNIQAKFIDVIGNVAVTNVGQLALTSQSDIRLRGATAALASFGQLVAPESITLDAAQVYPSTAATFTITAAGDNSKITIQNSQGKSSSVPLSAQGNLTFSADNIVQNGTVRAPLGQINFGKIDPLTNALAAASHITFGTGSLTSVSAEGSLIPYAVTVLGGSQMSSAEGNETTFMSMLNGKKISINGSNVDMQSNAKLDISGGGDTQAFEWIQGIGGSKDILNAAGYYAVLPSLSNQYAPYDYNMFGKSDVTLGQAVYLAGGNGLSAGTYTLLPAHYALLPGAFLVKVDGGALPVNTRVSQLDGSSLMSGYMTQLDGTSRGQYGSFNVLSGNVFYANAGTKNYKGPAEYKITYGNDFFTNKAITDDTATSQLSADAGQLAISATNTLNLDGQILAKKTTSGKGALVDISSNRIQVVSEVGSSQAGVLQIEASQLNQIEADSVMLGGTRAVNGNTQTVTTQASQVEFANDADHQVRMGELIVTANDQITVNSGAVITTEAAIAKPGVTTLNTTGAGAVLALSANNDFDYSRTNANNQTGNVAIAQGAEVQASRSAVMDATQSADKSGSLTVASGGSLTLGANQFVLGDSSSATGTRIDQVTLQSYGALDTFIFNSYQNIDVYDSVSFGNDKLNLTFNSSGIAHHGSGDINIVANTLTLKNTSGTTFNLPADAGTASLTLDTQNVVLANASAGSGNTQGFNLAGFGTVAVNAAQAITMEGQGRVNVNAAQTVLNSAVMTAGTGANYAINASGTLQTTANGQQAATTSGMGAVVSLTSSETTLGGNIELLSGQLTANSTNGDLVISSGANLSTRAATKQFDGAYTATSDAGNMTLASTTGNVVIEQDALVDVSGGSTKGAAGTLTVNATNGQLLVADGSLKGTAATGEKTGSLVLDVGRLDNFSSVNQALETGNFNQSRDLRVRGGDVTIAAGDTVTAQQFTLGVDQGNATIAGHINADGASGGDVAVYANGLVTLTSSATVTARGTEANQSVGDLQTGSGGTVLLSSNSTATLNAVSAEDGAVIDVSGYKAVAHGNEGVNGAGGSVTLVGRRGTSGSDTANTVNVAFNTTSAVRGASEVNVEGMRTYTSTTFTSNIAGLVADTNSFYNANATAGSYQATQDGADIRVLPYIIVKSTSGPSPTAMSVTADQNLRSFGSLMAGQGGTLALLSNGNLTLNGSLSDGFSTATSAGVLQANAQTFSYQLVAGADYSAANLMQTVSGTGNLSLAANKVIRTGTGDISMAAGGDITLANNATIYTIGEAASTLNGFNLPSSVSTTQNPNVINAASYVNNGGDISIQAQGNITGSATTQSVNQWLLRQGGNGTDTSWWIRNDLFNQGVAALGGGNVTVNAGGNVTNLSAASATNAQYDNAGDQASGNYVVNGGGDVSVTSNGNITNGVYYVGRGQLDIHAGDSILKSSTFAMGTTLALQDASAKVTAANDLRIDTVFNPTLWVQGSTIGISNASASTFFNTYSDSSALNVASLFGEVEIGQQTKTSLPSTGLSVAGYSTVSGNDLGAVHPGQVYATAFNGDMTVYKMILAPSEKGQLELMAEGSVIGASPTSTINTPVAQIVVSDADMVNVFSVTNPTTGSPSTDQAVKNLLTSIKSGHATTPVHTGDETPIVIIAKEGDVQLLGTAKKDLSDNIYGLQSSKPVYISAGRNVAMSASIQHNNVTDISMIKTGNDFVMQNGFQYAAVNVNGPGDLIVQAGRNIDLGNTSGIQSQANNVNPNLPQSGANITLLAGVGKEGANVDQFVSTYIDPTGSGPSNVSAEALSTYRNAVAAMVKTYMEKRTGTSLSDDEAMQQYLALDTTQQAPLAYAVYSKEMVFAIKDYVQTVDTARGDAAIASLFPRDDYSGDILMYQSQVRTARDANINIMVPGGLLNAGVAANNSLDHDIGIVTERGGSISVYADQGFQVNQSKVATLFGGELSAWVNNGDVDAGRGSKTAVSVPERVINTDNDGNVTVEVKGVATGSGLSTSTYDPDGPNGPQTAPKAGTVYLAAPRGTLDAGEAGVASGADLFIGAQVINNASNITAVGASTGVPVADTGSLAGSLAGVSSTAAGVSNAMTENLANQMPSQNTAPKETPPIVTVKTIRLED
jgi:filamentous hemagglutinin